MGDGSGGANTADSYIGSIISLTSKSEIRYEGILYTVDTENSNIALQNVRSFGTEGRKKDGPLILPSDKVYDYIIFRGSDIKDLQVKSSPSIQAPPQPPADPAIISLQSQYSQSASSIAPAYVQPPPGAADAAPQLPYPGLPPSAFRGGVPTLYQPTAALGSWGPPPPPPGPNGAGFAMPMYWQGYYRPPGGQPLMQQQLPPQPPPTLPGPPILQPQVEQLASRLPQMIFSTAVPLAPAALAAPASLAASATSALPAAPAPAQQSSAPLPSAVTLPIISSSGSMPLAAPVSTSVQIPVVSASFSLPSSASASFPVSTAANIVSSVQGVSAVITPAAKNPRRVVGSTQQSPPQVPSSGPSSVALSTGMATTAASSSASGNVANRSLSAAQTRPTVLSVPIKTAASATLNLEQKNEESPQALVQPAVPTSPPPPQQQTQPLLPLPISSTPPKQLLQGNGSVRNNYARRGRGRGGRGIGLAQPTQLFMEDFDFTAMNEKFKKDEVWGELGGKGDLREKVAEVDEEDDGIEGQADDEIADGKAPSDGPKKPVYVKDDFFDSLSCDALDREEGRAERTKFSEQRKIDTETFGNFPLRSRGGRGGRGGRRGGYRGGYYGGGYMGGRGNGYGRGRGPSRSSTAIN